MSRRRGIRNLASRSLTGGRPTTFQRISTMMYYIFVGLIALFIGVILYDEELRFDFARLSLSQYQIYVYGRADYCDVHFDNRPIVAALRTNVLGQTDALNGIANALHAHQNISSIAIIGTQGTGKSLSLEIIAQTLPWQYSMQHITFDGMASQQSKLHRIKRSLLHLNKCGQNGIFVDGLRRTDAAVIGEFDAMLREHCTALAKNVLTFYVFNLETEGNVELDGTQIKSVYYRRFNNDDLRRCIEQEVHRLGVTITESETLQLMQNIDVGQNGCKTVPAKVARHIRLNT